jgi:peptidoglycan hydrolase-like protein with peptidoglycan-binding domain
MTTPHTSAVTLYPWPVIRRSRRGHPIRSLQCLLRAHRHHLGVDGIFGPETERAVRSFQASRHLAIDGIVGPRTWSALIVTVRRGDRGQAVRAVQEDLARREPGNPSTPLFAIDGVFGPVTERHVRWFQSKVGIVADGIVGPITWQAMMSGMGAD